MSAPAARASSPGPRQRAPRTWYGGTAIGIVLVLLAAACRAGSISRAPRTEFILAAGDSSYWVRSDASGITLRGSPLVLARVGGRFYELYVVDDDRSFDNAVFIGQRLFERDIASGDSIEIFHDTIVPALAGVYEGTHPDAEPLDPDEDPAESPEMTATADVSVLGVLGPFLSIEHHVDTTGSGDDTWHTTRHTVIDLRTGTTAALGDILGAEEATAVVRRGRRLFAETLDSLRADRRPAARRAARAIRHFRFDPTSFSLTAPNGTLMVAFSAPGQGTGGEGFVLPMRPIPVAEPAWWRDARTAVPVVSREREEQWQRARFVIRAAYDTGSLPVRLTLVDSARREYPIGGVAAPVHRIYWLDASDFDSRMRNALSRAFDEAAAYDDETRAAAELPIDDGAMRVASLR